MSNDHSPKSTIGRKVEDGVSLVSDGGIALTSWRRLWVPERKQTRLQLACSKENAFAFCINALLSVFILISKVS